MIFSQQIIIMVAYVASVLKKKAEEEESVPMSEIVNLGNKGLEQSVRPRNASGKDTQLKFCMSYIITLIIATIKKSVYMIHLVLLVMQGRTKSSPFF